MSKFKEEAQAILERIEANKKYEKEHPGCRWGAGFGAPSPFPYDRSQINHDIMMLIYAYDPKFPGFESLKSHVEGRYGRHKHDEMAENLLRDFIRVIYLQS